MDNLPEDVQKLIMTLMTFGHDPLSKNNSTGLDYVQTMQHDTYDFIAPKQFDLARRSVFVTGASRGIGRSTAISYAQAGASQIALGARSSLESVKKNVEQAAKAVGRPVPQVLTLNLDVTSKESVAAATKAVADAFASCDILINNAGFMERVQKITEIDPDEWWHTLKVNVFGTFLVTRAFIPLLVKKSDGLKTIVNVVSMASHMQMAGGSAYQMSKFATLRFSELIVSEYGQKGLLAYSVDPGAVKTELSDALWEEMRPALIDTSTLPADTFVWLTAERREWLSGRNVSANWNMEELLAKKDKVVREDHLKMRRSVGLE